MPILNENKVIPIITIKVLFTCNISKTSPEPQISFERDCGNCELVKNIIMRTSSSVFLTRVSVIKIKKVEGI